jgi:hypothetical protein
MKPRRPSALTSPAPCGAFLYLSASPLNRAAQAPPLPRAAALPSALPLCPARPLPPRLGKPRLPARATSALPLCRCFPCPVPPFNRAGLGKPRPALLPGAAGDHVRRRLNPFAGTLPAPCRPGRAATVAAPPAS